ncbi:MAG: hypothetical protein RL684_1967 [Pseudomonadota bacterium]|jgi:hypothetical protein
MSAATFGLLDAIAAKPAKQPRRGAHLFDMEVDGIEISATYDMDGKFMAQTESDPAEYATVELRSVKIGDTEIFGCHAQAWDERLQITLAIEDHESDR